MRAREQVRRLYTEIQVAHFTVETLPDQPGLTRFESILADALRSGLIQSLELVRHLSDSLQN